MKKKLTRVKTRIVECPECGNALRVPADLPDEEIAQRLAALVYMSHGKRIEGMRLYREMK